jgi:hypothetical protein
MIEGIWGVVPGAGLSASATEVFSNADDSAGTTAERL